MLMNMDREENPSVVFKSYTGDYPNLCSGDLTLVIDGEEVTFGDSKNAPYDSFWHSGGWFGDGEGEWEIDYLEIPEKYRKYAREIDEVINENIPYGCCGGCR